MLALLAKMSSAFQGRKLNYKNEKTLITKIMKKVNRNLAVNKVIFEFSSNILSISLALNVFILLFTASNMEAITSSIKDSFELAHR